MYSQCLNNPFVHGFKKSLAMTLVEGLINSEIFLRIHIGLELQREVLQENLFMPLSSNHIKRNAFTCYTFDGCCC